MKYVTKYVVFIFSISFFDNLVGISQLAKTQPSRHLLVQSQQGNTRAMCEIYSELIIIID